MEISTRGIFAFWKLRLVKILQSGIFTHGNFAARNFRRPEFFSSEKFTARNLASAEIWQRLLLTFILVINNVYSVFIRKNKNWRELFNIFANRDSLKM